MILKISNSIKWNPCIAKIYQYDDKEEDRFVAIYTEENEDE